MSKANIIANKLYTYLKDKNPKRINKLIKLYSDISHMDLEFIDGITAIRGLLYFCNCTEKQILFTPIK